MAGALGAPEHYQHGGIDMHKYFTGDKRPLAELDNGDRCDREKTFVQYPHLNASPEFAADAAHKPYSPGYQAANSSLMDTIYAPDSTSGFSEPFSRIGSLNWNADDPPYFGSSFASYQTYDNNGDQYLISGLPNDSANHVGEHDHATTLISASPSRSDEKHSTEPESLSCPTSTASELATTVDMLDAEGRNQSCAITNNGLYPTNEQQGRDFLESEKQEAQPGLCFGALTETLKALNVERKDYHSIPIELRPSGSTLSLYAKDTGKYIGILVNPGLATLIANHDVTISTTLMPLEVNTQKGSGKTKKSNPASKSYLVRMILYGNANEQDAVANRLSDAGLYLQQPSTDECDRDTVYHNPQYMVRPGSRMPVLNNASNMLGRGDESTTESLYETGKNQLMRVFDSVAENRISVGTSPSPRIAAVLKEHQQTAIAFMVEKECGILEEPKFPPLWKRTHSSTARERYRHSVTGLYEDAPKCVRSGILADEMGLGKTLSVLALICATLDAAQNADTSSVCSRSSDSLATLIVTPKSTIPGWQSQIERHIHSGGLQVHLYHGTGRQLSGDGPEKSDIVITTYETLRSEWEADGPLVSKKWYRVVLDEAHHIRNRSSQIFSAACALQSRHRWCLTGTPIHNSLDDFGALLSFVGITPFLSKTTFDFWIATAMTQGKPEGLNRLRKLIEATCLRRTKIMVESSCQLPERVEKIQFVDLSPGDRDIYEFFREKTTKIAMGSVGLKAFSDGAQQRQSQPKIVALINVLRLICNHGERLLPATAIKSWRDRNVATSDWQKIQSSMTVCRVCSAEIDEFNHWMKKDSTFTEDLSVCNDCALEGGAISEKSPPASLSSGLDFPSESRTDQSEMVPQATSAKVQALIHNLSNPLRSSAAPASSRPAKSVIFSFWTKMLDIIGQALQAHDFVFQRIDGQSTLEARSRAISIFNNDPNCTIMLASIGSTGEGVDLKVANIVHLIEPQWNPMVEAQAVDRVHRIGQDREVEVIRYVVNNSVETYVRWLQLDKISLINRSVDGASAQQQQEINNNRWNKLRDALNCDGSS